MSLWNKLLRRSRESRWECAPDAEGLLLYWRVDGDVVRPDTRVPPTGTGISEAHIMLFEHLRTLVDDQLIVEGKLVVITTNDGFLLSTNAIYAGLQPEESSEESSACRGLFEWLPLVISGLPELMPVTITLRAKGDFASPSFSVETTVKPVIQRQRAFQHIGPFLKYTDDVVELLPRPTFELIQKLNVPWPSAPLERLRYWASLQPLVAVAEATPDPYLKGENPVLVDRIRPVPKDYANGELHIAPGIGSAEHPGADNPQDERFEAASERFNQPQSLYNAPGATSGGRTRFVLTPEAQDALGILKEQSALSGNDAVRSLTATADFFDHPGFDLEGYSDRVIGVGVYIYRALPYLGTPGEKRDWFAWDGDVGDTLDFGMELDSGLDDKAKTHLPLNSRSQIEALRAKVQSATENGSPYVEVTHGHFIPFSEALRLVEQAEGLAEAATPEKRKRLVFQILENIERREYTTDRFSRVSSSVLLPPPATLATDCQLLDHQVSGYSWLCAQAGKNAPGAALLADEMGLGKSLQVLCAIVERRRLGHVGPTLIVMPVSLLVNWQREANRFFPGLFPRMMVLSNTPRTTTKDLEEADLVLSSYETLRGSAQFEAGRVDWDTLVLDEAQRIKNPTTQTSIAIKSLKADFRIAVTATPVENSLAELWNIVDFLLPGYLASLREFHQEYILAWQNGTEQKRDDISSRLIAKLQPILLRRLKGESLDMPEKRNETLYIPMSPIQVRLYAEIIRQVRAQELHPLSAVRQLLYACAHPGLIDPSYSDEICPKLEYTFHILETVRATGEKALIFTGSRSLQTLLRRALEKHFGILVETINGSTPPNLRQTIIDRFGQKSGFSVLLLSPRAAGLGLNITAATHVIHYTRDWNPAIEAQSTDRAHRIGQTKPVTVHFPIVSSAEHGSAEQKLDELLRQKSILASSIVRPTSELEVRAEEILARVLG